MYRPAYLPLSGRCAGCKYAGLPYILGLDWPMIKLMPVLCHPWSIGYTLNTKVLFRPFIWVKPSLGQPYSHTALWCHWAMTTDRSGFSSSHRVKPSVLHKGGDIVPLCTRTVINFFVKLLAGSRPDKGLPGPLKPKHGMSNDQKNKWSWGRWATFTAMLTCSLHNRRGLITHG